MHYRQVPEYDQAVTTHATNPIRTDGLPVCALYATGAGTLVTRMYRSGADQTYTVAAGTVLVGAFTHVRATSTATGIIAQWW